MLSELIVSDVMLPRKVVKVVDSILVTVTVAMTNNPQNLLPL